MASAPGTTAADDRNGTELDKKWMQSMIFYDVVGDGKITPADFLRVQENILKLSKVSDEKKLQLSTLSSDLWEGLYSLAACDPNTVLSLTDAVCGFQKAWTEGRLEELVITYRGRLFSIMDLDDDGYINYTEFLMFADSLGRADTLHLDEAFAKIDVDGDGLVTKEEYIDAYLKYFVNPSVKMEDMPLYGLR